MKEGHPRRQPDQTPESQKAAANAPETSGSRPTTPKEQAILTYLQDHPESTATQVAQEFGIGAYLYLKRLTSAGYTVPTPKQRKRRRPFQRTELPTISLPERLRERVQQNAQTDAEEVVNRRMSLQTFIDKYKHTKERLQIALAQLPIDAATQQRILLRIFPPTNTAESKPQKRIETEAKRLNTSVLEAFAANRDLSPEQIAQTLSEKLGHPVNPDLVRSILARNRLLKNPTKRAPSTAQRAAQERRQRFRELLQENPDISAKQVAQELGIAEKTAVMYLNEERKRQQNDD